MSTLQGEAIWDEPKIRWKCEDICKMRVLIVESYIFSFNSASNLPKHFGQLGMPIEVTGKKTVLKFGMMRLHPFLTPSGNAYDFIKYYPCRFPKISESSLWNKTRSGVYTCIHEHIHIIHCQCLNISMGLYPQTVAIVLRDVRNSSHKRIYSFRH
jgi:hypothetical protein